MDKYFHCQNGEWQASGRGTGVAGTARRKQSFPARAQPVTAQDPPANNSPWTQAASENVSCFLDVIIKFIEISSLKRISPY